MFLNTTHLKAAALFASREQTRYYLNGVCVDFESGASMVATDGHRMFAAVISADAFQPDESWAVGQIIIPFETIKKALTGYKLETIELLPAVGQAGENAYTLGDIRFSPIDGTFPDWRRVVPSSASGETAQFDAAYVGDMAKAAKILGVKSNGVDIAHNGASPAIVTFGNLTDCVAVLMPVCRKGMTDADAGLVASQFTHKPAASIAA